LTDPRFLHPHADTTPAAEREAEFAAAGLSGLPSELLEEASRRLGWAALLYAAIYFFAFFGPQFAGSGLGLIDMRLFQGMALQTSVASFSILFALCVFAITRSQRIRPALLLDLGLVFEVVGAFGIAMAEFWSIFPEWNVDVVSGYVGISWVCFWIVVFPILAPNTPGKVLLASLIAASMPQLVVLLSQAAGATSPDVPLSFTFYYFLFTTYLSAGGAYVVSRLVYRYGVRLKKAQEIGSYCLLERLGTGGMGEVWRAEHCMLAREAAIKLIHPDVLGANEAARRSALRRFEREARATAALGSTHTIRVYDFGRTDEGSFFYVMELLDGLSLEDLVKEFGPQPAGRVATIMEQVCHSLGEAHARGLIHRDVKPANIYTCRLGPDHDFVKVLDFGLVKATGEPEPGASQLTAVGVAAGTPAFMAPEMATGKGTVDGRADIYALGCVAYWLLTGLRVFEADTPLQVLLEHVQTPPPPLSQRTEVEVPAALEQLVMQCLAKDPADRPQTAAGLAARLRGLGLADEWTPGDAEAWWQLHMPVVDAPVRPAEPAE
jgi:serine/threonine-protein kinase